MFKRFAILVGVLIYLGVFIVVFGVASLNSKNWIEYKTEFLNEKSSVVNNYLDNVIVGLENVVYSNAYWTEALVKLETGQDAWLAENATTYITDQELFGIDYIFIANESLIYTQESGLELGEAILLLPQVQDTLVNNDTHFFVTETTEGYAFVLSSPWMTNEEEKPTGVYVAMSLLDEEFILGLKGIVGGDSVNVIEVTHSDEEIIKEVEGRTNDSLFGNYKNIALTLPLMESEYSLSLVFEMKSIYNIFSVSRNYILTIVVLSASFVFILILFFVKYIEKLIVRITSRIKDVSEGNYEIRLEENSTAMFKEINDLAFAINRMSKDLKNNLVLIDNNYLEMADVIIKAVEINDFYTSHHNIAVGVYAKIIATEIGYEDMQVLELAAKLHDIGKISIPSSILNKPDKLTTEEFEIIKTHPVEGYNIIHNIEYFSDIRLGILNHHERWDGTGYPNQLKGDDIPLMAQIISIADVYDALTSDRAYRLGMSHKKAIDIIVSNSGIMFNPILIDAFLKNTNLFEDELLKRRLIE